MKNISLFCISFIFPVLCSAADFYHVTSEDAWGCNERKITGEINDATHNPNTMDPDQFQRLAAKGKCSPISPSARLKLIRKEQFKVPAGPQSVGYMQLKTDMGEDYFYVMFADLAKQK